jgi:hypothetical protein
MNVSRSALFSVLLSAMSLSAFTQGLNPEQEPDGSSQGFALSQSASRGTSRGTSPGASSGATSGASPGTWGEDLLRGRGTAGIVEQIAPDHFEVKTASGDFHTVYYSVNTRFMKDGGGGRRRGRTAETVPPQPIKASDIRVGDAIAAAGEVDGSGKSVGAVIIFQIDPERAKELRAMESSYGKTWLAGKVVAVNDVRVTLRGGPGNATHSFVADENTAFRRRSEPITLREIRVGDLVRAEGAVKNGMFLATVVAVMGQQRSDGGAPSSQ